jgi:hypothetical protein
MSEEKRTTTIQDTAEQAERLEKEAGEQTDVGSYTHVFEEPFTYEGTAYERLTFNWKTLSGKDSVSIQRELLNRNVTTVIEEFTPEYLAAMAARACTYRNADGFRMITTDALYALPLPDFRAICAAARRFLLRSGSRRGTAGTGSGNNA